MTPVSLDRLVPDLTLKDFDVCKVAYEELTVGDKIGEGGAASVFRGVWKDKEVAIKKLKLLEDFAGVTPVDGEEGEDLFSKAFHEFRREVWVMRYSTDVSIPFLKCC